MLSEKPWRAEAVLMLVGGMIACLCGGVLLAGLLQHSGLAAFKMPESLGNLLLATLSFQGAAWVFIFFFLKQHGVDWRDAFGFRANLKKSFLLAAVVLVVLLPVALGLQHFSALALKKAGWLAEDQRAVELIANSKSFWLRGYLGLFAIVIAPVAEEFIFRGMLFPFFLRLGFRKFAWLGVSFLFALIHFNAPTLVPLFVFALMQTWLYEKTDCLLAPIAVHSLFNTANLVILLTQSPAAKP
jgi:membrane protease YdiL (CAAX protease family)